MAEDRASGDLSEQISQLAGQVGQLYQEGRYREAIVAGTQTCELARRHWEKTIRAMARS